MMPSERLQDFLDSGRLIRKAWTGTDAQGRETACLLAALSPEVAATHNEADCPADIMPQWLAYLTPWFDDAGSVEAWPTMKQRFAGLVKRWSVLTATDWRQLDYTCRRIAVEEAAQHYNGEKFPMVRAAIGTVIALCCRAENSDYPSDEEWEAARATAEAAEASREAKAAWVAIAAAEAAEAAFAAARVAARAAGWAAEEAAADRITAAIFDAIEVKIAEAEKRT